MASHLEPEFEMSVKHLKRAIKRDLIDELLDESTPSKPAHHDYVSCSLFRIHLDENDPRLPAAKAQIKAMKQKIATELQEIYGETWEERMPHDVPIPSAHRMDGMLQ